MISLDDFKGDSNLLNVHLFDHGTIILNQAWTIIYGEIMKIHKYLTSLYFLQRSHAENIKGTLCNKSILCLCKVVLMILCRGQKLTILHLIGIPKITSVSSETYAGMRSSDLFLGLNVKDRSGNYLGCS